MKHPNRQRSTGQEQPNFFSGEIVLCLLICIISALILSSVLTSSPDHSPTVYTPSKKKVKRFDKVKPKQINESIGLKIEGYQEAHEKLSFYIPNFHGYVKYELDLGNGDIIEATKPKINYTYSSGGRYEVSLWGTYNGEKKLLTTSQLHIIKGIEVADDAYVEVKR